MSIKQAIEALELAIETSYSESTNVTFKAAIAALRSMPSEPEAKFQPDELEQIVDRYLDEYELIGEDCNGLSGCYTPTDTEKALIKDAICGLLADAEWDAAWGRQIDAARATPHTAPLSDAEIELIDGMIEVQLHHASQCDGIANRTMAEKQKGWDMERVALLRKLRGVCAAAALAGEGK